MSAASRAVLTVSLSGVLAIAASSSGEGQPYTLERLSPRRSFGRGGIVRSLAADGERIDGLNCIAFDSAGRILVAGSSVTRAEPSAIYPGHVPAVARLSPDGRLDRSFGGNGIVLLPLAGRITGLAVDRQDRVAVAGPFVADADSTRTTVAVRLLADGTPDPGFAEGGFLRFDVIAHELQRLCADPRDDALVGIGIGYPYSEIVRITAAGALDPSFGTGGRAPIPAESIGLAIDAEGRCVVTSEYANATVRVLPDGTQDPTFGSGGLLRGPRGGAIGSRSVAIDGQQRIVLRGYDSIVGGVVCRFLPTGQPDPAFGESGVAAIPDAAPANSMARELALGVSHGAVDRYAFASTLVFYGRDLSTSRPVYGSLVQAIDPADPRALASRVSVDSRGTHGRLIQTYLRDVAVSDDGATAYAVGSTEVVDGDLFGWWVGQTPVVACIDLEPRARTPLPDFTIAWKGQPVADRSGEYPRFSGRVRVTNSGPGDAANVCVRFLLSDDAVPSADDDTLFDLAVGPLARDRSRVLRFHEVARSGGGPHPYARLMIAVVNSWNAPESDTTNDVAVSPHALR